MIVRVIIIKDSREVCDMIDVFTMFSVCPIIVISDMPCKLVPSLQTHVTTFAPVCLARLAMSNKTGLVFKVVVVNPESWTK